MKSWIKILAVAFLAALLTAVPLIAQADVVTAKASGAVTAKTFVKLTAANTIATATAATDTVIGVCQTTQATTGGMTSYAQPGMVCTVTSGEAVTLGQEVQTGTGGKAFVHLATRSGGGRGVGIALSTAAAADADLVISFSPTGGAAAGAINVYTVGATALYPIGTRYVDETDGRVFRYAKAGTAGWKAGIGAFFMGSVVIGENLHANAAIGDTTVVIEQASIAADAWAGGYIAMGYGTANHQTRRIVSNTASDGSNHVTVTLDGPLTYTQTTSEYCEIIVNPYADLQQTTNEYAGVAGVPTAVATTGQYGWVQTWGPCWIRPGGAGTPGSTQFERTVYFVGDGSINGDVGFVDPTVEPERRQVAGFIIQKDSVGSGGPPFVMLQISP
jgi:hypothetical protein